MSQVNGNGKEGGLPDANSDVQDAADSPVFRCLQRIPFPLDKSMNSIRNLRCDFLLSLLPIDPTTGNILMPYVNQHWFNGFKHKVVSELFSIYESHSQSSSNPSSRDCISMAPPSSDVKYMVFRYVTEESDATNVQCQLMNVDSSPPTETIWVNPLGNAEFSDFFTMLQDLTNMRETDLSSLRTFVRTTGYCIAPIDGLHRQMIFSKLAETELTDMVKSPVFSCGMTFIGVRDGTYRQPDHHDE